MAISKPKTSIALQESDLNLTNEILIDSEMFIAIDKEMTFTLKLHHYYGTQWLSKFDLHLNT